MITSPHSGNAHYIVKTKLKEISERATNFIKWPKRDELEDSAAQQIIPDTIGKRTC